MSPAKIQIDPQEYTSYTNQINPHQMQLFLNAIMTRSNLAGTSGIGVTHNGTRDIYTVLGYKKYLNFQDYIWRYERQDIATRVVSAFPLAVWSMKPSISETDSKEDNTEFEKQLFELFEQKKVYHYLTRSDVISGIGRFGIILLGFQDGKQPHIPVVKKPGMKLAYMRPYHEGSVTIEKYDTNIQSPRFGQPEIYKISTAITEIANQELIPSGSETATTNVLRVHWTRVIHVVPELGGENDLFAEPRLKNVYNRLQDIDTIAGGSAEGIWRSSFQGFAFKNDEGAVMNDEGKAALDTAISEYVNDYKRYIKLQNMDIKPIEINVPDPNNHFQIQLTLISAAKGIPKRILLGSERGELASNQDETAWNKRVEERRVDHAELLILRPFIDRLIMFGVLPEPSVPYRVTWPDLYTPSGIDKAKKSESLMRALKDYLTMAEGQLIVPPRVFLEVIMNFTESEVNQCIEIIDNMSEAEKQEILRDEEDINDNDNNQEDDN